MFNILPSTLKSSQTRRKFAKSGRTKQNWRFDQKNEKESEVGGSKNILFCDVLWLILQSMYIVLWLRCCGRLDCLKSQWTLSLNTFCDWRKASFGVHEHWWSQEKPGEDNISKSRAFHQQLYLNFLGRGRLKHCLGPGYFLLRLSQCILKTCLMLLAGVRVHEYWRSQ